MFKNYLTVAIRNLLRHRVYSLINVLGLAVGMACCLLILLFVQHELSYDSYHDGVDQTYRVISEWRQPSGRSVFATTPRSLARALVNEFPEVVRAARLSTERADRVLVQHQDKRFLEYRVLFADPNIFDVLTIPFLQGDPETVLKTPFSIVLTEAMARKYFGTVSPIGKTLDLRMRADRDVFSYHITGVIQNAPENTHARFDFLATYLMYPLTTRDGQEREGWLGQNVYTYIRLREDASPEALERKFPELIQKYVYPQYCAKNQYASRRLFRGRLWVWL